MTTAIPTAEQLADAHAAGFERGLLRGGFAGDCPHRHAERALHDAWHRGFSEGRAEVGRTGWREAGEAVDPIRPYLPSHYHLFGAQQARL